MAGVVGAYRVYSLEMQTWEIHCEDCMKTNKGEAEREVQCLIGTSAVIRAFLST